MVRRLLFLLLLSPAPGFYFQEHDILTDAGPPRAPLSVDAAAFRDGAPVDLSWVVPEFRGGGKGDDDLLCGECPIPENGDDGSRRHGTFLLLSSDWEAATRRSGPASFPKHGLGPVLASLGDTLMLSRPPPFLSGISAREGPGSSSRTERQRSENP